MTLVIEVEFRPIVYPPPGGEYKTRVWFSRTARDDSDKYHKRKRNDSLKHWNKLESCCKSGLRLYIGTVLRSERGYEGIFRFGIPASKYRFYGFFDGENEFIVTEVDEKPGDMGAAQREACRRAAKVKATGDWKRDCCERYPRPT